MWRVCVRICKDLIFSNAFVNPLIKIAVMKRLEQILRIKKEQLWNVVIVGGGATGLGIAVDCATRGYKTLLLERSDFAKSTSSRSTKLLHGGVRYLAQGNIPLVYEALHERSLLIRNAPHLCKPQAFVIPTTSIFSAFYYTIGLSIYDYMAGRLSLGKTRYLNREEVRKSLSGIKDLKMQAGVCYYDGQFDDARLGLSLARTAVENQACLINYMRVNQLLKNKEGKICGVEIEDVLEPSFKQQIYSQCVINATGVFSNEINQMDKDDSLSLVISQGIHLVFDAKILPNDNALIVPKTSDGRVLFAIPWHHKLIVGTTDTQIQNVAYEPLPLEEEIDFLLKTLNEYTTRKVNREDILSIFVGLRPLIKQKNKASKNVSRSHKIHISESQLISINGGKWTTYRKMAEETIDFAIAKKLLPYQPCITKELPLYGYLNNRDFKDRLCVYGSDYRAILELEQKEAQLAQKIHPNYPYTYAQVLWALEYEMAETLEDVLSRRIRLLFLDAKASNEIAKEVGIFIGKYKNWSKKRLEKEIEDFKNLTKQYCIKGV